jgi:hypothetical protein
MQCGLHVVATWPHCIGHNKMSIGFRTSRGVQYLAFITRVFQGYHDLTWMLTTKSSSSRILKIQQ